MEKWGLWKIKLSFTVIIKFPNFRVKSSFPLKSKVRIREKITYRSPSLTVVIIVMWLWAVGCCGGGWPGGWACPAGSYWGNATSTGLSDMRSSHRRNLTSLLFIKKHNCSRTRHFLTATSRVHISNVTNNSVISCYNYHFSLVLFELTSWRLSRASLYLPEWRRQKEHSHMCSARWCRGF